MTHILTWHIQGGVNLNTIGEIAKSGVDRISVGGLTHQAVNIDVGLDAD
jgi:nicotinate-nucleotide pyrophosphorylase (carboxylating)